MTPEIKARIAQIRRGEVPEGYKKTRIGVLPSTWKVTLLQKVMGDLESGVSVNSDSNNDTGVYILKTSAVFDGKVKLQEAKPILKEDIQRAKCLVKDGCILISRMNTPLLVGECGYVSSGSERHYLPDRLWQAHSISPDTCSFVWLNDLLNSDKYKSAVHSLATGTSNSMKNISKEAYLSISIPFPSFREQQKIASILTTQDKVIELKEKLLGEKQRQKKALMQMLLTGKKRLPGFSGQWKKVFARNVFKNISNKNHDGTLEVLSATQDKGVIPRSQVDIDIKYDKGSLGSYKKVEKGNFVISLRSFQGGIEYSEYTGIVSPAYTVLAPRISISEEFYKQFFKSPDYISRLSVAVYGIRDGKQISYNDFGHIKIPYPPLDEQTAIADILSTADREIDLLQKEIEQEKQKKKALMQMLLTGIVRV